MDRVDSEVTRLDKSIAELQLRVRDLRTILSTKQQQAKVLNDKRRKLQVARTNIYSRISKGATPGSVSNVSRYSVISADNTPVKSRANSSYSGLRPSLAVPLQRASISTLGVSSPNMLPYSSATTPRESALTPRGVISPQGDASGRLNSISEVNPFFASGSRTNGVSIETVSREITNHSILSPASSVIISPVSSASKLPNNEVSELTVTSQAIAVNNSLLVAETSGISILNDGGKTETTSFHSTSVIETEVVKKSTKKVIRKVAVKTVSSPANNESSEVQKKLEQV